MNSGYYGNLKQSRDQISGNVTAVSVGMNEVDFQFTYDPHNFQQLPMKISKSTDQNSPWHNTASLRLSNKIIVRSQAIDERSEIWPDQVGIMIFKIRKKHPLGAPHAGRRVEVKYI